MAMDHSALSNQRSRSPSPVIQDAPRSESCPSSPGKALKRGLSVEEVPAIPSKKPRLSLHEKKKLESSDSCPNFLNPYHQHKPRPSSAFNEVIPHRHLHTHLQQFRLCLTVNHLKKAHVGQPYKNYGMLWTQKKLTSPCVR